MLYCVVTIDFMSQLERVGTAEASALVESVRAIAADFGAAVGPKSQPVAVWFPDKGPFSLVQTVEALRRMAMAMRSAERFLRGASAFVHDAASLDDAVAAAQAMRLRSEDAFSFTFSPEATEALRGYFDFPERRREAAWTEPRHASVLGDADARSLSERPRLVDTVVAADGKRSGNAPRLIHVEAGPGARSIAAVAKAMRGPRLVLSAASTRLLPFSPLVEAISLSLEASADGKGEPAPACPAGGDDERRFESAFRYVAASSFAEGIPASVARGCAAFMERYLDALGAAGGSVFCDSPERFSQGARDLVAGRLAEGRGAETYTSISDGPLMDAWKGPWAARVSTGSAERDDAELAVDRALGSAGGSVRATLGARFSAIARGAADEPGSGAGEALALLPREAAIYLYCVSLAENELSPEEFTEFTRGLGLRPEGQALLRELLSRAGLLEPGTSLSLQMPLDRSELAASLEPGETASLGEGFAGFLIGRYRSGRIRPSLGFLRRVGERPGEERLAYDCLFEEVLRPDGSRAVDPGFLSASSLSAYRFWEHMLAADRGQSEAAALAAEERMAGPRAAAVCELMKAELSYASGDAERSAKHARAALISLGQGAAPKLEARSQRMMGLSALAEERLGEAGDYLSNAQELAESSGDDYERMMASYARALVEYLNGALVRATRSADMARESASRLFRMDAIAVVDSLAGRIDMELGSYDEAARRFAELEALAGEYGFDDCRGRAGIWRARALAYAREYDAAAEALEARSDDPEARVFRGELDILRGRPRDARAWLDEPAAPLVRGFKPPDSFDWSSLFAEMEGRSIGFGSADAPLAELREALSLFARGLDERDPECALALHAMTRNDKGVKANPGMGVYSFFCYLLEERLAVPPVDKQTVLSRAFKILQQRAGKIEDRAQRTLFMEQNIWNKRLIEAARTHKFI